MFLVSKFYFLIIESAVSFCQTSVQFTAAWQQNIRKLNTILQSLDVFYHSLFDYFIELRSYLHAHFKTLKLPSVQNSPRTS